MSDKRSETRREHIYHGHRAQSVHFPSGDDRELLKIRAFQRTVDGAAYRTAMGNLSYAVVILKLFDARFYQIGALYIILSIILLILAYLRNRQSKHDFANSDNHRPEAAPTFISDDIEQPKLDGTSTTWRAQVQRSNPKKVFEGAFRTMGWSVVAVSSVVFAVEVAVFALILVL